MPDATITSTASTFGTISGTFAADQSTIVGTVTGIVAGTLDGSVGVPGPAGSPGATGATGATGPAGPAGSPGQGVPAGGTAGQFLQKTTTGVDYATDWVTVNLTGLATESWVTAGFYPLTGNPSGFLTASALTPYITSATAASTYQTLAGMSSYLTTSAAAAGYYPLSGNPSGFLTAASLSGYATESWVTGQGYITSAALSPYLTTSTAASTYQTLAGMSSYLTTSAAASTYQTLTGMSDYLAKSSNLSDLSSASTARTNLGLGSLAVVNDAPSDGSQYARKNGAWDVVSVPASYISSVSSPLSVTSGNLTIDLSAYAQLSGATFTGNVFAPTPSPGTNSTRIATTEWVKDFDFAPTNSPHFTGNPQSVTPSTGDDDTSIATTAFVKAQNYITSAALSGYATESWVTSQGYLTSAPVTSVAGRTGAITLSNTDISGLGTMSTATAADYSTTTVANGLYYPLSSNPASYLVAADIAGKADLASPALTGNVTITSNSTGAALFVTQTGTGNILTLHDQASDTTFVAIDQNGKVSTIASTTAGAGFFITPGTAPTTPINGDVWLTTGTTGVISYRAATTTQTIPTRELANTFTNTNTFSGTFTASGTTASLGTATTASTVNVGTGAIASGTKTVNIGTAGTTGSTTNINIGTTGGGTATANVNALLVTRASATTGAGLRIMPGTAPTSPVNGDVWTDTAGIYARINGSTVTMSAPSAATVAEAKLGNDTAKFINCNVLQKVVNSPSYYKFPRGIMSTSTSGTGAAVTAGALLTNMVGTTTGAGGALHRYYGFSGVDIVFGTGYTVNTTTYGINFGKQMRVTGSTRLALGTNSIVRVSFGKNANQGVGDPNQRAIGWRYNQTTGFIEIVAHNGTSLVTLTTASNPVASGWFEWELYSNGAGSVQMFVNDVSIGTLTGGPTTFDYGSAPTYVEEVECTATPSAQPNALFRNGGVFLQP